MPHSWTFWLCNIWKEISTYQSFKDIDFSLMRRTRRHTKSCQICKDEQNESKPWSIFSPNIPNIGPSCYRLSDKLLSICTWKAHVHIKQRTPTPISKSCYQKTFGWWHTQYTRSCSPFSGPQGPQIASYLAVAPLSSAMGFYAIGIFGAIFAKHWMKYQSTDLNRRENQAKGNFAKSIIGMSVTVE